MREVRFFFGGARSAGGGKGLTRFVMTLVSKSADQNQLFLPDDLPTKVTLLADGTYLLVFSRKLLPIHSSTAASRHNLSR